jgi:radical SAM superfamily enzyme YgiQ (UPF0313 family)
MSYFQGRELSYKINSEKLKGYSFELGPIRPPSEGQDCSLLIRVTRNCPWNRCEFCPQFKGKRFEYRSVAEVKNDIDIARGLADELKSASWRLGFGGEINEEMLRAIIRGNSEIYQGDGDFETQQARLQSLIHLANWLNSGARTVFLQDANSLIWRTPDLVEILQYIKQTFPSVERITSYARSKTAAKKSLEELKELYQAGLSRLHIGLESGDNEVLKQMQKGVTAEEHILGGRNVVESGISLSEYVMPGLGGRWRTKEHALETARVLSEIYNPDFIRLRTLLIRPDMPLYTKLQSGEFELLPEDKVVEEINLFIQNLQVDSYLISDHMSNLLMEVEGKLPEDKPAILKAIDRYLGMSLPERLEFQLQRRLRAYLAVYGGLEPELKQKVEEAFESIQTGSADAEAKVDQTVSAIRSRFM